MQKLSRQPMPLYRAFDRLFRAETKKLPHHPMPLYRAFDRLFRAETKKLSPSLRKRFTAGHHLFSPGDPNDCGTAKTLIEPDVKRTVYLAVSVYTLMQTA
ncbi:hypothetical protein [Bacteroides pyogenes]|uniref:hypothetical protein n=1 Tax=Bacteroides pyogenes TaxID=310300 RepID=UPI0011E41893|nr:hypothetical protein [Bacteroides pyogenes]MDY4249825.1 hypothetical protein [Bacteroides pyogenes]TYK39473.1 hypothetical protein FNJ61_03315 [Bacteroides pyogenes]